MKTKTLGILAGITLLVILIAFFTSQENGTTIPESGQLVFPDLMGKINDVEEITLESREDQVTLVRGEKSWGVKEKEGYHADINKVKRTLIGMAELRIREPKTSNPDLYDKLGVQDHDAEGSPSTRLTLKAEEGKEVAEIVVGNQRPAKGDPSVSEIYVRKSGDPQAWLVTGKLAIENMGTEWLDKEILDLQGKRIQRVTVKHPEGETVTIQKEKPDDQDYKLVGLSKGKTVTSQFTVNNIGTSLAKLTLDDVQKEEEIDFSGKPGVQAKLETFDGLRVTPPNERERQDRLRQSLSGVRPLPRVPSGRRQRTSGARGRGEREGSD